MIQHFACDEMQLLIQADLDGELDTAATAALSSHVRDCPACTALAADLTVLSAQLRREILSEPAPPALRRSLETAIALRPRRAPPVFGFLAGAAMAAAVTLAVLPRPDTEPDLLTSHLRALQPGHLTDVLSSDQHTVKPWFDGRIDYAPPVTDFSDQGFPLVGGRLDYLAGRPVAALVYRRDRHPIDLYIWPATTDTASGTETRNGYTIIRWTAGGMTFRAVSALNHAELQAFAALWQARPPGARP